MKKIISIPVLCLLFLFFVIPNTVFGEMNISGTFWPYSEVSAGNWGTPTLNDSACVYIGDNCIREIWRDLSFQESTIWKSESSESVPTPDGSYYYIFYFTSPTTTPRYIGWTSFSVTAGVVFPNSFDTDTRIISTTPNNGQTVATSTTHTIGATGYLNSDDFNDYSELQIHLENSNNSFLQCADVICAGFSEGAISRDFSYDLLVSGSFSYSSTTQGLPTGKYWVTSKIVKGSFCFLGVCAFRETVFATSTTFTVATTTKLDKLKDDASEYIDTLTGSDSTFEDCTVVSFDFFTCMSDLVIYMFVPEPDAIQYLGDTLHDNILTHFPVGYVTDFVNVISTSTATSLTVIDATLPNGIAGAGAHIELDLTGVLDQFLNATTSQFNNVSATTTESLFTITNRYWSWIVYILTLFYILGRILGSSLIPRFRSR